jgi:aminomethyltransferase
VSDPATVVGETPTASEAPVLRHTALIEAHRRLGAKLTGFGGWEMPLAYPTGTVAEHLACRRDAVIFDVSHLGTVRVVGPPAFDRLQETLSNDLRKVHVGRAQYTHLLDDADGSVVDDIIVWWVGDETFDVMPNASNTHRVVTAVGGTDTTAERCVLAVQGPRARERLAQIAPDAAAVPRFGVTSFVWHTTTCMAAGTGYTGEDGVECVVPVDVAEAFWNAVLAAGVQPAGLGARDTLRLEAALPLHGHELGPGITPLQAGLGWVVGWDKPSFLGRKALLAERDRGVSRRLAGLATEGRQPPREGGIVLQDGRPVGSVTSGNFSPVLGHGIALALLEPTLTDMGTVAEVEQRGRRLSAVVAETPFVRPGTASRPK